MVNDAVSVIVWVLAIVATTVSVTFPTHSPLDDEEKLLSAIVELLG